MNKKPKIDWGPILKEAFEAAAQVTADYVSKNHWYPCGFAWVNIKPARGKLVELLKDMDAGYTSESGGYNVYNPSKNPTQSMDAKAAGARAFAEILKKHGVNARVETRID